MSEASSGAAWDRSLAHSCPCGVLSVLVLCGLAGQKMEAEWRWLTEECQELWFPNSSADRGARGVAGSGRGWAGMTGARQTTSEGRETK